MPQNLPIFHCSNFYSFRISGETDDGSSGSKNEKDEENMDSILSHLVSTRYIFLLHATQHCASFDTGESALMSPLPFPDDVSTLRRAFRSTPTMQMIQSSHLLYTFNFFIKLVQISRHN